MASVIKKYAVLEFVEKDGVTFDVLREVESLSSQKEVDEFIKDRLSWTGQYEREDYFIVEKYQIRGEGDA